MTAIVSYQAQRGMAARLLAAKGAKVLFVRQSSPDPLSFTSSGPVDLTFSGVMVATAVTPSQAAHIFGPGANAITKRRLSCTCSTPANAPFPREGDRFRWAGDTYRVMAPQPLDPDGSGVPIITSFLAET